MIINRLDLDHERSSQDLYMKAQRRRYNHLATTWTHSPRWNYSRIIPEKRPRRTSDLPSGRVPRRTSDPPDLGMMVAAATNGFMDILSGTQGFCIGGFL